MSESIAKRWCFTINFQPTEGKDELELEWDEYSNIWGTYADGPQVANHSDFEYIVAQRERGENGTLHWQGFLVLKDKKRLSWLKRHFSQRAHFEVARGTNQQCRDYCRKAETYCPREHWEEEDAYQCEKEPGRWEYGHLPEREVAGKLERIAKAADQLDELKVGYKRPQDIDSVILMQSGFLPAMKELTMDVLGPYRPHLKIVTLIGPPGSGKSYAIQHFYPGHGRCIVGNSGVWFQQPLADVMVFEEFCGQIQLQRMLQYLDPYPLALEIKGSMRPALYTTVVLTSNTTPDRWYRREQPQDPNWPNAPTRRDDALLALYDRLGFQCGAYIPVRTTGHYFECPTGMSVEDQRHFFWSALAGLEMRNPTEDSTQGDLTQQLD